jgi:hypothetical protein
MEALVAKEDMVVAEEVAEELMAFQGMGLTPA